MRILVSNDDGFDATGIQALAARCEALPGAEVWVVAPEKERSAQSHALTLHKPLRVRPRGRRRYAVSGTPADCVYMGLHGLLPEPPDVVISGVNRGANLGSDVYYSGTVAAAREAVLGGVPAVAVSLALRPTDTERHDDVAADLAVGLAEQVVSRGLPPRTLLNLNVPNLPRASQKGIRPAELAFRRYDNRIVKRQDPWGRDYYWLGGVASSFEPEEGTDGPLVRQGYAAVTPIHHDLTHRDFLETLRDWLP